MIKYLAALGLIVVGVFFVLLFLGPSEQVWSDEGGMTQLPTASPRAK